MKIARKINGLVCEIELTENELFNAYEEQQFLWDRDTAKERLSQADDDAFGELTNKQFECVINQVTYEMRRQMDKYGYGAEDALDQAISIVKKMDLTPLYERCAAPENDGACQHLSIEPEADNIVPAGAAGEQPKEYWMRLHYGWEESVDDGVRHAFEASDPENDYDDEVVERSLRSELAPDEGCNFNFDWDITMIKLPESLVKRIQADAVKERGWK